MECYLFYLSYDSQDRSYLLIHLCTWSKSVKSVFNFFFVPCFFLLLFSFPAAGQNKTIITKYNVNNGLSSNNVRNIVEDPYGFMWIATEEGFNRFDGKRSLQYSNTSKLCHKTLSPDIRAGCFDTLTGQLYVLNSIKGFSVIDPVTGNIVKEIIRDDTYKDDWNITMNTACRKLWVGSAQGLNIYNIQTQAWEKIPVIPFLKNKNNDSFTIRTIYSDSQYRVWIFVENYGVLLFNARSNSILKVIPLQTLCRNPKSIELAFTSFMELTKETFLLGTSEGLKKIKFSAGFLQVDHHPISAAVELNQESITAVAGTRDAIFIAATSGLYKADTQLIHLTHITDVPPAGKSWLTTIHYLYTDKNENLWVACERGLALIKQGQVAFEKFNNEEFPETRFNKVYQVKPIRNGYLIGMKSGLVMYTPETHAFKFLEKEKRCNFFFEDANANIILSMKGGLQVLRKDKPAPIETVYPEWEASKTLEINSVVSLNDSTYLMGSENDRGIALWNYKAKQVRLITTNSKPFCISSNTINKILSDHQGNIWILLDKSIDIIQKDWNHIVHLRFIDKQKKAAPILFFDFCETSNYFWITSYGLGLIRLNKNLQVNGIYTTDQGLSCNCVYKIFNYNDSMLILTTNRGLSVFDSKNSRFHNFFETDGLHSNTFEENSGMEYNGKFIAGGLNGFTVIDPSLIKINRVSPKLYIDQIDLESPYQTTDTSNLLMSQLDIPSDIVRVGLHLSAINFKDPGRTQTTYKIDELNEHWISKGERDIIQLMGLPPGMYTLRIRSFNEHGIGNDVPLTFKLHFLPKWYQSMWFRILVLVMIILGIFTLYRFRLNQIKKQHAIRRNIASDLHDDIGSSLNTVKIFAHMAKQEKNNMHYLDEIESALTNASVGMRDMIWVLDDTNDSWRELIDRIKKFALPLLTAQGLELQVQADETLEPHSISKEEKKNILLITKEAINNSVKYAACKTVSIRLQKVNDRIVFTISDDGVGFDTAIVTEGNGLKNMNYRASLIRYKMVYTSQIGKGTEICLRKG